MEGLLAQEPALQVCLLRNPHTGSTCSRSFVCTYNFSLRASAKELTGISYKSSIVSRLAGRRFHFV